jgi:hypothetical protein
MADKRDSDRDPDDLTTGAGSEDVRGIANEEDDEFDDAEDLEDEEEGEDEESTTF